MSTKNTTPELFCENTETSEVMTQEDILMNEKDILSGLLEAGQEKDSTENYHKIQIKRHDKIMFEFRIRPLAENETRACWKKATRYAISKPGQPKRAIETDTALYRSYLVYTATVDEDRVKVWDNKAAQNALGVLQGVDMVDKVLLAGEKSRILEKVDEISGFDDEIEEFARD